MATRRKTKTRWLRTRIEKEGFPFCMCCIFKAKFLHHYCKVSDQDGLSAVVFSGSIRPFLYAFGPWQCFTFSNSTYCPPVKTAPLGLVLPLLWQRYSWGEHLPFPSEWASAPPLLCRGKPHMKQEHPHHNSSLWQVQEAWNKIHLWEFICNRFTKSYPWQTLSLLSLLLPADSPHTLPLCCTFPLMHQHPELPFLPRAQTRLHGCSKGHSGRW